MMQSLARTTHFLLMQLTSAESECNRIVSTAKCSYMTSYGNDRLVEGFGYKWSPAVRWEDLIAKRGFTLRCPHSDQNEAAFRFQAWAEADANDIASR